VSSLEKPSHRRAKDIFGVVAVVVLVAFAIGLVVTRARRSLLTVARAGEVTELRGPLARVSFSAATGHLTTLTLDGRSALDVEMSLVVDGAERPLVIPESAVQMRGKGALSAIFPIEIDDEHASGALDLTLDSSSELLAISLVVTPDRVRAAHSFALSIGTAPGARAVFVPGVGAFSDLGSLDARAVLIDDDVHPFAFASTDAVLTASLRAPDVDRAGAQPRLVVSSRTESTPARPSDAETKPVRCNLMLLVGSTSQSIWGRLYRQFRVDFANVSGVVIGGAERAHVMALDGDGYPQIRAAVDAQGRFVIDAPKTATLWHATLDASTTSAPISFPPGTPWDLKLDVSPGGTLHVRVVDADTREPMIARLLVKGIEGTMDPSFGPDYRASGAGPLMDMLDGEAETPLPAGHYRVAATHGLEWSVDAESIEITSGEPKSVELALRHVVPTPGMVACDLHVHARPSFDSPVIPEDRVLSLVSAGIDFAVPSEHNIVGDYGPAIDLLHVGKQLSFVTGVEVTTDNPSFGHFGVFPYPRTAAVPPSEGTTADAIFSAARRNSPNGVIQVNHPRLQMGIGYFEIAGFDPNAGRIPAGMRADFDTLEVYNGYESQNRADVERVMEDWFALLNLGKRYAATGSSDSHRIQYQWAGYPRTFALVDPKAAGDTGLPVDTRAVVAALKKGRSFVSSGPVIEFELASEGHTAKPGDDLPLPRGTLGGTLRVRAAPWVDVTSVDLVAGVAPLPAHGTTQVVFHAAVPSRPTFVGKEDGTPEESAERALRFEANLDIVLPEGAHWMVAIVRGDRRLDDVLPFMPIQPLAFTNPIWLVAKMP